MTGTANIDRRVRQVLWVKLTHTVPVTANNHWGTFHKDVVRWYAEVPDLREFMGTVFELGRREEVWYAGEMPSDLAMLSGGVKSTARVSVFGPSGIEEQTIHNAIRVDCSLAPEAYAVVALDNDIWFPRVVGINDDTEEIGYDNSELARSHTPRFNRFLTGLRDAATALGGTWEFDVENRHYVDLADESGIHLEPMPITTDQLRKWGEGICRRPFTSQWEVLTQLMIPGVQVGRFNHMVIEPAPFGLRELRLIERDGEFSRLDMRLGDSVLTRADLDQRFGQYDEPPRVHWDSDYVLLYDLTVPDALYGCRIAANFSHTTQPVGDTPVIEISLRRQ